MAELPYGSYEEAEKAHTVSGDEARVKGLLRVASIKNSKNIWEVDKTSTLLSMSQGRK